jgi:regulator of protease activity HflC (stomatin/prohibitin superfamily)
MRTIRFEDVALAGTPRAGMYYSRYKTSIYLGVLLTAFLLLALAQWIFVTVPAGHVGVMWYRLGGTDTGAPYGEGSRLMSPWNRMEIYDARVQQLSQDFTALTKDGLSITVNASWQFRINDSTVGLLHKFIGPAYVETVLAPLVGSYTRQVFSHYTTDEAYTLRRSEVQDEIRQNVVRDLGPRAPRPDMQAMPWIILENVLIRAMTFPPEVAAAVNRKMEQYQFRQEYAYRLERERLESERKAVEADGIARFQHIVGTGISENYLRWKGIDATLALAQSNNAKVIVIGSQRDGMPLILNGNDAALADGPRSLRTERTKEAPERTD